MFLKKGKKSAVVQRFIRLLKNNFKKYMTAM